MFLTRIEILIKKTNRKMIEKLVKDYQDFLNKESEKSKELFTEPKRVSLQVCLFKIPNLVNDKQILW